MGRKLSEVLGSLPDERRQRIQGLARDKAQEMVAAATKAIPVLAADGEIPVDADGALSRTQDPAIPAAGRADA